MFPRAFLVVPFVETGIIGAQPIEQGIALVDSVGLELHHVRQLHCRRFEGLPEPNQGILDRQYAVAQPHAARPPA
jgi:hypothetical protein